MGLQPEVLTALIAVIVAAVAVRRSGSRRGRAIIILGAAITVTVWLPLIVSLWLPDGWVGDNPVGLGLMAWFGTYVGVFLIGCGVLVLLGGLIL